MASQSSAITAPPKSAFSNTSCRFSNSILPKRLRQPAFKANDFPVGRSFLVLFGFFIHIITINHTSTITDAIVWEMLQKKQDFCVFGEKKTEGGRFLALPPLPGLLEEFFEVVGL